MKLGPFLFSCLVFVPPPPFSLDPVGLWMLVVCFPSSYSDSGLVSALFLCGCLCLESDIWSVVFCLLLRKFANPIMGATYLRIVGLLSCYTRCSQLMGRGSLEIFKLWRVIGECQACAVPRGRPIARPSVCPAHPSTPLHSSCPVHPMGGERSYPCRGQFRPSRGAILRAQAAG